MCVVQSDFSTIALLQGQSFMTTCLVGSDVFTYTVIVLVNTSTTVDVVVDC